MPKYMTLIPLLIAKSWELSLSAEVLIDKTFVNKMHHDFISVACICLFNGLEFMVNKLL